MCDFLHIKPWKNLKNLARMARIGSQLKEMTKVKKEA